MKIYKNFEDDIIFNLFNKKFYYIMFNDGKMESFKHNLNDREIGVELWAL